VDGHTIDLIHKTDLDSSQIKIRGYECYTSEMNKSGYFVDTQEPVPSMMKIRKLPIPDCYQVGESGYLMVPDLKTSEFLRSKGDAFELPCEKVDDEFWRIQSS
jgi:hypothetical protein